MKKRVYLFLKWLLFPGLDISTRKRMRFTKYLIPGNIKTLDAGCGNGAFSYAAARLGNSVLGIDFDTEKLRRCEEFRDYLKITGAQCRFKVWNIYKLEKLNERFDQIICFETLEHLLDDGKVLDIFFRMLEPGGILHLCTPRGDRKPFYGEKVLAIEDGGHVRLGYTADDMKKLLIAHGFSVQRKDGAVGFFGYALLNLMQAISLSRATRGLPENARNMLGAGLFCLLYPFTALDAIIPAKPFNVYVRAEKPH